MADIDESVYVLDPDTMKLLHLDVNEKNWSTRAPCPWGEGSVMSMASSRDKLFVAGGHERMCACYNITSDSWCMLQQPLQHHIFCALVHYDNKLLLLGGEHLYSGTEEVEEYNADNDSWSVCCFRMPGKLSDHYALVLEM